MSARRKNRKKTTKKSKSRGKKDPRITKNCPEKETG